ncbi:MAG: hypothetical protein ACN4GF_10070 [Lentimonas sp.]
MDEESVSGSRKIEYETSRLDDVNRWVNILYIQATGKGDEFTTDIMDWADYCREPRMAHYFNNMNLLHVSYAAFGKEGHGPDEGYLRCRRYPKADDGSFSQTEKPDSLHTGLFHTVETYHVTAIKNGDRLFFHVQGEAKQTLFSWHSILIVEVSQGRIGLRHMWMKSARYENFTVSVLRV